jgi:hypothetical protein
MAFYDWSFQVARGPGAWSPGAYDAIEAVAEALLEHETLTEDAILKL